MTKHTPNSRNINNNPNTTSSNVSYSHKIRGTHTRVSRVRVATVNKAPFPEKQHRSCPRCKESTNSMKILNARVDRIEQLVDVLAKTTRGLTSMSKRDDRFAQSTLRFRGIDLTRCTLQELQKLVVATTNIMVPSITTNTTNTSNIKKSTPNPSTNPVKDTSLTDITITTNNEKKILHSEPAFMEDVKILQTADSRDPSKVPNQKSILPIKNAVTILKQPPRQDSGYCEIYSSCEEDCHGEPGSRNKGIKPSVD